MSREICILQQDTPEQGGLQVNVTSTIGIQPIMGAAVKIFSGQTQVEDLDNGQFRPDAGNPASGAAVCVLSGAKPAAAFCGIYDPGGGAGLPSS